MNRWESRPAGHLVILLSAGVIVVLTGVLLDNFTVASRMPFLAFGGLLALWGILGLVNCTGFDLETPSTLRVRRDSPINMDLRLTSGRAFSGMFIFGRTPGCPKLVPLPPDEWTSLPITPTGRGRHSAVPVELTAPFPFGPQQAGKVHVAVRLHVLPRQIPAHLLNLPRLTSEFDRARLLRGTRDGAFKGLAEYSREHSLKEVNWKASARAGKLVVNEYEGVMPSRKVLVAPDPTGGRQNFEYVLDFTYSLLEVLHLDWQVFLYCFDGSIFHLPKNSLGAVEDYFLDLYPLGNRPKEDIEFPGLKILVTPYPGTAGGFKRYHWRICHAYDILNNKQEHGVG